ncbi:MAG TPA: corrinoid protein [Candidatus Sulfomarinibacteraceae bacterium]|nr:corrinoid protein [Candidatus Sulfomarinibacteraceae bacterium]
MELLNEIGTALENGDHGRVAELVRRAVDDGVPAGEIIERGLLAGMDVVGRRFGAHEIFLPDVLLAARAMKAGMDVVRPLLVGGEAPSRGTVVLGTVRGDVHDIGKNLVATMLAGAGFEIVDLGTDVAPERFVEAAVDRDAAVVGLSALLTTTMGAMREVVELVRERGLEGEVKVLVGGAPVTQAFADEIGADAYAWDAGSAVEVVKGLVGVSA